MTRTKPKPKVQSLTIQDYETEMAPIKPLSQVREESTQTKSETQYKEESTQTQTETQVKEKSTQMESETKSTTISINDNEMRQNVCSTKVRSKEKQKNQSKPKQTKLNKTLKAKITAQGPKSVGKQNLNHKLRI